MKTSVESPPHLIKWSTTVEVEAAVERLRPSGCLIRDGFLNK
jgi:hypothetical protein